MKMIDVLNMMTEDKIENDTKLIVSDDLNDYEYRYSKGYNAFLNKYSNGLEDDFYLDKDFLNLEVELRPPKEQKYRIKLPNTKIYVGLGYDRDGTNGIYTYTKNSINEVKVDYLKCRFREKDFEEIEELKPYEQFKELVKDDENE